MEVAAVAMGIGGCADAGVTPSPTAAKTITNRRIFFIAKPE
jgi:hypothetical protein